MVDDEESTVQNASVPTAQRDSAAAAAVCDILATTRAATTRSRRRSAAATAHPWNAAANLADRILAATRMNSSPDVRPGR